MFKHKLKYILLFINVLGIYVYLVLIDIVTFFVFYCLLLDNLFSHKLRWIHIKEKFVIRLNFLYLCS